MLAALSALVLLSPSTALIHKGVICRKTSPFHQVTTKSLPLRHSRLSILRVSSGQFNDEDKVVEPNTPSEPPRNNDENDNNITARINNAFQSGIFMQVGIFAGLAIIAYTLVTMALSGATNMASSASHALSNEVVREIANLGSNVWALLVYVILAIWQILKVLVPFVGKGIMDAGKAAAPVVSEASSRFTEAATPYVQEATRAVNEVASPYVNEAARVVDESFMSPVRSAVDANVVAPLTSQIDAVQNTVTSQIGATVSVVSQTVTSTIQEASDQAASTLKEAVDAKIMVPIQDVTSAMDESVKSAMKPIQESMPF